jgi:hypothetical protein
MKVLLVLADPSDEARLRLLQEKRVLEETLRASRLRDSFDIRDLPSCRLGDLQDGVGQYKPTILHFSGHGSEDGLCFENDRGLAQVADPQLLANFLSLAARNGLKGVILNACYSSLQAPVLADAVGSVSQWRAQRPMRVA